MLTLATSAILVLAFVYRGLLAAHERLDGELYEARLPQQACDPGTSCIDRERHDRALRSHLNDTSRLLGVALSMAFGAPCAVLVLQRRQRRLEAARQATAAERDGQTDLPNRAGFMAALDRTLTTALTERQPLALLQMDVDRLKEINDTQGRAAGDAVLRTLARRFAGRVPSDACVARIGDDEFGLVLTLPAGSGQADTYATALIEAASSPIGFGGRELRASASVGLLVVQPGEAADFDAERALARTAMAVAAAKAEGRNRWSRYEPEMDASLRRRRAIEQWVRRASAAQAFELHFQPLFDATQPTPLGFEALLRMRAPDGSLVSPAEFIPVAEEIGLISEIGRWVLVRACEVAARWTRPMSVAVNLSPAQFVDGSVCDAVRDALSRSGLAAGRLQLEITEGLMMHDSATVLRELRALKELGVSIAMDDFGTGYSSLSYLWRFPFDKIKIDRAFVSAWQGPGSDVAQIIRTIVALGHALGMRVNAEGVETPAQAAFLRELGCDELQGFLLGRPQPESAVDALFARYTGAELVI